MSATRRARNLFIMAFTGEVGFPPWIESIEISEPPYSGPHTTATAKLPKKVLHIKVLGNSAALDSFRALYPSSAAVLLEVSEHDTLEEVRSKTFELLSQYR